MLPTPLTDALLAGSVDCGTFWKIDRDDIDRIRRLERDRAVLIAELSRFTAWACAFHDSLQAAPRPSRYCACNKEIPGAADTGRVIVDTTISAKFAIGEARATLQKVQS